MKQNVKITIPLCIEGLSIGGDILVAPCEYVAGEIVMKRKDDTIEISQTGKGKSDSYNQLVDRAVGLLDRHFDYRPHDVHIELRHKHGVAEVYGYRQSMLGALVYGFCQMFKLGHSKQDVYAALRGDADVSDEEFHYLSASLLGGLRANINDKRISQKVYTPGGITLVLLEGFPSDKASYLDAPRLSALILASQRGDIDAITEICDGIHSDDLATYAREHGCLARMQHAHRDTAVLLCPSSGVADDVYQRFYEKYSCLVTSISQEGIYTM